jgi:hypothetical protein
VGIAYEEAQGTSDLSPGCYIQSCHIIGKDTAVKRRAEEFKLAAEQNAKEQWNSHKAHVKAKMAA